MIEGVNASIASAALVRPVVEQAEQVRSSYAANPQQIQQIPQAPYVSPYIAMDYTYDRAVLQLRDSDTGEVVTQIPTDTQLRAYKRAQQVPESVRPEKYAAPARQAAPEPEPKIEVQRAPEVKVEAPQAEESNAPAETSSVLISA